MDKPYRIPPFDCPKCGYHMDSASNMTGEGCPEVGDCTVCINCGQVLRFGIGLAVVVADIKDDELTDEAKKAVAKMLFYVRLRGLLHDPVVQSKWGKR